MWRRFWLFAGISIAINFVASCTGNTTAISSNSMKNASLEQYSGRISLVTEPDVNASNAASTTFSGSFELRGNAQFGELDLLTPLGQVAAQMRWQPAGASLRSGGETRYFSSASAMLEQATGAALSPDMLMAWLQGDQAANAVASASDPATGTVSSAALWQVDLSRHSEGRIIAKRLHPAPVATLRIILELP